MPLCQRIKNSRIVGGAGHAELRKRANFVLRCASVFGEHIDANGMGWGRGGREGKRSPLSAREGAGKRTPGRGVHLTPRGLKYWGVGSMLLTLYLKF